MDKIQVTLKNVIDDSESIILIKRIKRSDLASFLKLQRSLLEEFIYHNGAAGNAIADNKVWSLIEKISKIVPLIPMGTLHDYLPQLEENIHVLNALFFSASWDIETGEFALDEETKGYKSSLLYKLNDLDYTGDVKKGVRAAQIRLEAEEQREIERIVKERSGTLTKETATS